MSAAEVIEDFKRLPTEEQNKVIEFLLHLPTEETLNAMEEARKPDKLESYSSSDDFFKSMGIEC